MNEITAAEGFDPTEYEPHGIVCGWCLTPLTEGNAMQLDITGDKPWERTELRVYTYACVGCVVSNRIDRDPDGDTS